jgi:hypothetical protein
MSEKSEDLSKLKLFTDRQDAEAKLHWSRNSYFLVVMSILILAFGQKPVEDPFQLAIFRILVAVLGVILSFTWLLIQHRSSQYILYYKGEARKLAKITNTPDVYPETLGGIEIRKLAYVLPIAFLFLWLAFIILVLVNFNLLI